MIAGLRYGMIPGMPKPARLSPYDTLPLSILRFTLEIVSLALVMLDKGLVGLVAMAVALACFATPGDKSFILVKVPGPVRALIEIVVFVGAAEAASHVLDIGWTLGFVAVVIAYLYLARGRLLWLLRGAPREG